MEAVQDLFPFEIGYDHWVDSVRDCRLHESVVLVKQLLLVDAVQHGLSLVVLDVQR